MNREQLEHVTRAAGAIVGVDRILVIGSQSILGSYSEGDLPTAATVSDEADIAFFDDPKGDRALLLDGTIGEKSPFHDTNGYYGQGVSVTTAILPEGWRDRLVPLANPNTGGVTAWCLEVHDLCVAKTAAGRDNDIEYCEALIRDGFVDIDTYRQRLDITDLPPGRRELGEGLIRRAGLGKEEMPSVAGHVRKSKGRAPKAPRQPSARSGRVWVPGHVKEDGTRVKGYWRG